MERITSVHVKARIVSILRLMKDVKAGWEVDENSVRTTAFIEREKIGDAQCKLY